MKRSLHTVAVLLLALAAVPAFGPARETVDFSQPPPQGLSFRATDDMHFTMEGTISADEQQVTMRQEVTSKEVFTQTYLEVAEGRIHKLERAYEDVITSIQQENDMMPEPQTMERTGPMAWKTVRAEWRDDRWVLKVKEGDSWKDPSDAVRKRLTPKQLLCPALPLPEGEKAVGEKWTFDREALKEYFPAGMMGEESEVEANLKCELAAIEERQGQRCAVIKFELTIQGEAQQVPIEATFKGTAYYSLKHRLIIEVTGTGTMKMSGEMEQMGRTISMDMKGPIKTSFRAEIQEKAP